jgi:transposase-like protein
LYCIVLCNFIIFSNQINFGKSIYNTNVIERQNDKLYNKNGELIDDKYLNKVIIYNSTNKMGINKVKLSKDMYKNVIKELFGKREQ